MQKAKLLNLNINGGKGREFRPQYLEGWSGVYLWLRYEVTTYLPVYKSTFYSLQINPKNCLDLYMGQKQRLKKIQD